MTRALNRAFARIRRSRPALQRTCRATLAALLMALVVLPSMPATALPALLPAAGRDFSALVSAQPPGSAVIDYPGGFSASLPVRLRRAGVGVVVRYVGAARWKSMTRWEANALRQQGIDIATVYETKANWMLGGRAAGVAAAKRARAAVIACGGPRQPFVYFACDVGTKRYGTVNSCLRGAASVLGADHVGIYGSYSVCENAIRSGAAAKAWQTEAWSGGKWLPQAVLYQKARRFNGSLGIDYDSNLLRADDIGQWNFAGTGVPSWTATSSPAGGTLNAIDFADDANGWAVGEDGAIVHTADGGATWSAQSTLATSSLRAVAGADASTAWAVGEGGAIVHTADGGATWSAQASPATGTLTAVAFSGVSSGWVVGENGAIVHTADGGATWSAQASPVTRDLRSVAFTDGSSGWAVGDAGVVLHTADGGANWTAVSTPATGTLRSIAFTGASTGWAVGDHGAVIHTSDGGATWAVASTPATGTLTAVTFPDANTGWIVGANGTALRTTDGGSTWAFSATPVSTTLNSVAFADANTGCAVGDDGTLMRATRSGAADFFGHVAGVVTDARTGAPVSGASVQIGSRQAVPTATDGSFVVARVPTGVYTVTVTSPRYITCSATGVLVTAGATATVRLRPVPRTATSVTPPHVSPSPPVRGQVVTFTATLSPAAATSSTVSAIYFSHYEQKTVTRKVKGKRKKVKVWYWRQIGALRTATPAPGLLYTQTALPPGRWRMYVRCLGSGTFLPSTSGTTSFSVL